MASMHAWQISTQVAATGFAEETGDMSVQTGDYALHAVTTRGVPADIAGSSLLLP